ncbi:hypothetical protein [Enterococcus pingfangensis]|uniref:hypothetical protein n=1 Tax=Enterococcus pingfangensis TaxID=2559924 RepID=UPI0010F5DD1E|nr:hypothetical protein [Enterococcus pingfangensis]
MKKRQLLVWVLIICLTFSQFLGTIAYAVAENGLQTSPASSTSVKSAGSATSSNLQTVPENAATTETTDSSAFSEGTEQLAEGKFGSSSWYITSDFTLVIQAGKFANTVGESPWITYKDKIQKILIAGEVTLGSESSHLFQGLSELIEIDSIENLKILESTKMNNFFDGCEALKEVDFSKWDTRNVSENDAFLSGCEQLETIKLGDNSNFQPYGDENKQDQSLFIWKGANSTKTFNNIAELLSNNGGGG